MLGIKCETLNCGGCRVAWITEALRYAISIYEVGSNDTFTLSDVNFDLYDRARFREKIVFTIVSVS
jgi:hypothetical protein